MDRAMSTKLLAKFMSAAQCRQKAIACLDPALPVSDAERARLKEEAADWNSIAAELEYAMSSSKSEPQPPAETKPACSQCAVPMTRVNSIPAFDQHPQLD